VPPPFFAAVLSVRPRPSLTKSLTTALGTNVAFSLTEPLSCAARPMPQTNRLPDFRIYSFSSRRRTAVRTMIVFKSYFSYTPPFLAKTNPRQLPHPFPYPTAAKILLQRRRPSLSQASPTPLLGLGPCLSFTMPAPHSPVFVELRASRRMAKVLKCQFLFVLSTPPAQRGHE